MKRYPWWRHALVAVVLILATIYALPSAYPSAPTVDVRARSGETIADIPAKVKQALAGAGLRAERIIPSEQQTSILFADTEAQLVAHNRLEQDLGPNAIVALNTRSSAPAWLSNLGAHAIALGLDLRGGVHFLLQVDLDFAVTRFFDNSINVIKTALGDAGIKHSIATAPDEQLLITLADPEREREAFDIIARTETRLDLTSANGIISAVLSPRGKQQLSSQAVEQNVETLRRRVDELGVAEPVIAQQGADRIVVQLPGLQDTARAKGILGRRAALEMRGVDERATASETAVSRARTSGAPSGTELLPYANGQGKIFVERRIVLTGENIIDANYGGDDAGRPAVHLALDALGAAKIKSYTRERVGEQLAIVLIEQDRTEVISAPRIDSELHARFLIRGGGMGVEEASELALLLRSGSLATPIEIVEERTIGPSLGADNIRSGLGAVTGGFFLVAVLIAGYYGIFGLISVGALLANLLCLTALLAVLGAGLTLPGLAGFALTLGMAIDANVLINERIREELLSGQTPGLAIETGFRRAFATILDANITTLIAGLALFALGSGPVRGFAVVLCLGIATSMFTAIVVARAFVDLVYGHRRSRLKHISIG